jgi:hypothetical protein
MDQDPPVPHMGHENLSIQEECYKYFLDRPKIDSVRLV